MSIADLSPNSLACTKCHKEMPMRGSSQTEGGKPWRAHSTTIRHQSGAQFTFSIYLCDPCHQSFPNGLDREQFIAEQFEALKTSGKTYQADMDKVRRDFSPCSNCRSKKIKAHFNVAFDAVEQTSRGHQLTVSCSHCGEVLHAGDRPVGSQ